MAARLYPALMRHEVGRPQVLRGQLSTIRVSGSIVKEVCLYSRWDLPSLRPCMKETNQNTKLWQLKNCALLKTLALPFPA
jgi:hypothetical protein